jgi:serine phosphatase RsbU (regulator of sigma subunit)
VRILDTHGRWAEAEALPVTVLAPWYLQWWAVGGAALMLILLVVGVVRLNTRRLKHQKEVLERTVAERTAEVNKQKEVITEQNENLLESIRYAERIQKVMLPKTAVIGQHFASHYLMFRPRNIVSGDFYWLYAHGDTLWVAAADCTGHGVPGALMSAIGINLLNVIVAQDPAQHTYEVLNKLDEGIRSALHQHEGSGQMDGMDIALCKFSLADRKVEFSGANRPLYLQRGLEMLVFDADRSAIGGTDVSAFTSQQVDLQPSDRLFLFSDGYPDQFGKVTNRKMGIKRMRTLLEETANLSLAQQGLQLEAELNTWQQDAPQTDDILVLGLEVR